MAVAGEGARGANAKVKCPTSARRERGPWLRHLIFFLPPVTRDGWRRVHPLFLEPLAFTVNSRAKRESER